MTDKRICVYCGSSSGTNPALTRAAADLGNAIAEAGYGLVYGGANRGLMGTIADTVMAAGGDVIGVMPESLVEMEVAHDGLSTLHVVSSMHERKSLMADLSDAFIAQPGGLGTLEELFEIWTWTQLGFHDKPVALFNTHGFFDGLIDFLHHATAQGFIKDAHLQTLIIDTDPASLIKRIADYEPTSVGKLS